MHFERKLQEADFRWSLRRPGEESVLALALTILIMAAIFHLRARLSLWGILGTQLPIWVTHFDRDRVPFYQKPDSTDPTKVLNADLLFPPILADSFGGEILGLGQRQDTPEEMYGSLEAQGLSAVPYEWYITYAVRLATVLLLALASASSAILHGHLAWIIFVTPLFTHDLRTSSQLHKVLTIACILFSNLRMVHAVRLKPLSRLQCWGTINPW